LGGEGAGDFGAEASVCLVMVCEKGFFLEKGIMDLFDRLSF